MSMTNNKVLIGAGAAMVVLVGGWFLAKQQAASTARDRIDGFLIRNNLRDTVSYDGLSASPFGSVKLSGVKLKLSPAATVAVDSLALSGIEMKNDQLRGLDVEADGIDVPLLAMTRADRHRDGQSAELIGLGYINLTGKISLSMHYDDQKQTIAFETAGDVKDAGAWKLKLGLGGVDSRAVAALSGLNASAAQANPLALLGMAGQGLQYLGSLTLSVAEISVDNSGLTKRQAQLPDQPLPPEGPAPVGKSFNETELVHAGMAPSEAQAARQAVDTWLAKGGTLKLASNLSQPMPLFIGGNLFTPAIDGVPRYLAATKSRISN